MDNEKLDKVAAIYEQLLGLFHGLGTPTSKDGHQVGGPIVQYQHAVQKLSDLTNENLSHFLPDVTNNDDNGVWYSPADLKGGPDRTSGLRPLPLRRARCKHLRASSLHDLAIYAHFVR